ncbi:MAG: carboxyltransferase domain-containing protein, partial [Pseudooceanicola nanhaiensis]
EKLHTPRLAKPRQSIVAGAIGIGGQQGSINSVTGPSGWRFVGWTPWRTFDAARAEPFLFAAGDRLRFVPVSAEEAAAIAAGEMPEPEATR